MTPAHPTRELASALAAARITDLDATTVDHTQRAVLDWLGSAMAGAVEPPARMAHARGARLRRGRRGDDVRRRPGVGGRRGASRTASRRTSSSSTTSTRHRPFTAAAPIVSAALAVAEREHASGERFLTAVAVGYEAAFRIGEAVNPSHYRFWHPTGPSRRSAPRRPQVRSLG